MLIRRILPMAAGLAILGASAGAQQTTPPTQPPPTDPRQPVQPPQTPPRDTTRKPMGQMSQMGAEMDDRAILAAMAQGNDAEIMGAEMAMSKTRNPEVRTFAQMMQRDHSAGNDKIIVISRRLSPTDSLDTPETKMKREEAETKRGTMEKLEGAAFDNAYVAQAVADHRAKLTMIDTKLLPAAKDPAVRSLVTETRPGVAEHLRQAELLATRVRGTRAQATIPPTPPTEPASTTPPRNPRS